MSCYKNIVNMISKIPRPFFKGTHDSCQPFVRDKHWVSVE